MGRQRWAGLVTAVLVLSCSVGLAEDLVLSAGAVGGIAPDGVVGPELSLRLLPLKGSPTGQGTPYLWLDVAATTDDFSDWGVMTGLSADLAAVSNLTAGIAQRGGFGRDWTREVWVLYVSRSFSSLLE